MMKRLLILLSLLVLIHPLCAQEPGQGPFQSVTASNHDAVVVKLPAKGGWSITLGSAAARAAKPDEEVKLVIGTTLRLQEKHTTYSVKAVLAPQPGLLVDETVDEGGVVANKKYFIPAKQPEKQDPPKK